MKRSKHNPLPVAVCAIILGATAAAKAFALWQGNALLSHGHPWLPGTFLVWLVLGLMAEAAALVSYAIGKRRLFLKASLALGSMFIAYHWYQVWQNVSSPCPCLGGVLGNGMAGIETAISFALAVTLAIASFIGLCQRKNIKENPEPVQCTWIALGVAALMWTAGTVVFLVAYHNRDIHSDEGMEASKALLVMEHPQKQSEMWNDQPPLLTHVFATLFHWFGPSLTVTRIFVAIIGLLMPITWFAVLKPHQLTWAVAPAVAFLWMLIPDVIGSAQMEPVAYAVATAAAIPLVAVRNGRLAFVLSVLIGIISLNIKLTAAFGLVLPFTIIAMVSPIRAIGWGLLLVAGVAASSMAQPNWSWATMVESHMSSSGHTVRHIFDTRVVATAWLPILFAVASFCYRYATLRLKSLLPIYASLFVALWIHILHQPYWGYYSLHFVAPICLLGGVGVVDVMAMLSRQSKVSSTLVYASISALVIALFIERSNAFKFKYDLSDDISESSPLVAALKKYSTPNRLGFSTDSISAFAARLTPPPWITIVPAKRVWSGNLSENAVIEALLSNEVPVIAIPLERDRAWNRLLTNYSLVELHENMGVYVSKDIVPEGIVLTKEQPLKRFGL